MAVRDLPFHRSGFALVFAAKAQCVFQSHLVSVTLGGGAADRLVTSGRYLLAANWPRANTIVGCNKAFTLGSSESKPSRSIHLGLQRDLMLFTRIRPD
jgi:hypothetical protein